MSAPRDHDYVGLAIGFASGLLVGYCILVALKIYRLTPRWGEAQGLSKKIILILCGVLGAIVGSWIAERWRGRRQE